MFCVALLLGVCKEELPLVPGLLCPDVSSWFTSRVAESNDSLHSRHVNLIFC